MSATATLKPSTELTLQQIVSRNMRMALGYYNTDQKTLAKALGQASSSISLKMRGKLTWSLEDIEKASGFFNVKPEALVAGHGFEPWTSGNVVAQRSTVQIHEARLFDFILAA